MISKRQSKHFIFALPVYPQQMRIAVFAVCGLRDQTDVLRSVDAMATIGCFNEPFHWRDDETTAHADWYLQAK